MKKQGLKVFHQLALLFCGLLLFFSGAALSLPPEQRGAVAAQTVKARLTEIFGLCQSGRIDEAAAYFVYRGADKSREWKDTFRATREAEKAEVAEICQRVKGYLDKSDGYSFGAVKVERESEGAWHVLEVSFRQSGQTKKTLFAFLRIKGKFSIGDID